MTVKEAIEKLSKLPENHEILIEGYGEWFDIDFVENKRSEYDFNIRENVIISFVEVVAK